MKKIFLLSIMAILLLFCSCEKPEKDPRDAYVGTWECKDIGSLSLYFNGEVIGTVPINETGNTVISKSGESGLKIDGKDFFLTGNRLITDPLSENGEADGMQMFLAIVYSGQVSNNLIVIPYTISGNWSKQGDAGNLAGSGTITLTR